MNPIYDKCNGTLNGLNKSHLSSETTWPDSETSKREARGIRCEEIAETAKVVGKWLQKQMTGGKLVGLVWKQK